MFFKLIWFWLTGGFQFKIHPSAVIFVASNGPSGFVGGERTLTRNCIWLTPSVFFNVNLYIPESPRSALRLSNVTTLSSV